MKVALLGLGVVGMGVYEIITSNIPNASIKYILEKDKTKAKDLEDLVIDDYSIVLNDKEIDTVIELIGGLTAAYKMIKQALQHKKNVITANKAVISKYFKELHDLAVDNNVQLRYEASVGGGIIVVDSVATLNQVDETTKIQGIINGSTNYVLTKIFKYGFTLDQALKEAFDLGYLETGSNDDLEGFDLLRKINILSMISYNTEITENQIIRVPLSTLSCELIDYVKDKGLTIKYVATSLREGNDVMIHLEPVVLPSTHYLSGVDNEYNIVTIYSKHHHIQSFYGQGAGRYPTATAVVYDLKKILNNSSTDVSLDESANMNCSLKKYNFIVQYEDVISVERNVTFEKLQNNKDIKCFARIEGDVL